MDLSGLFFTPSDQFDLAPLNAAVLNPANGSVVSTFLFPAAFTGDILASGVFALAVYDVDLGQYTGLQIYDHLLNLIATIDSTTLTGLDASVFNQIAVVAWEPNQFYVAWSGDTRAAGTTNVTTISSAGVPGPTVWTLPNSANSGNMPPQCTAMGVSISGQYLYYSDGIINGSLVQAIHRYDLFGSAAATDLISTGSHTTYFGQLGLVQANDDVIVLLNTGSDNFAVKRYNSSGALQQTYALVADAGSFDDPILGRDPNPLFFWVHTFEDGSGNTASYAKITISDGSSPVSWTINSRNSGLTDIPLCCPFFIFGVAPVPPGPQATLVFDMKALGSGGRWFPDTYTPGVRMRTWEPGAGVHNQVLGHVSGDVTVFQGQSDQGAPIAYAFRVPDVDAGDPRRQKAFGDLILDVDPANGAGFTITPAYDDFEVGLPSSTKGAGLAGRQQFIVDVQGGLAQLARNLGIQVEGSDIVAPIFYLWEVAFIPKVEDTLLRATDWDDAGYFGAKFVQGLLIEADTFGGPKQLQVESDCGGLSEIFTLTDCTDTLQENYAYSFAMPFIAHLLRIVPVDDVPWRFYRTRYIFEPSPEAVSVWQTQPTTLDLPGYTQEERILIAHMSTSDFDVSVTADGVTMTYRVPNSNGNFVKTEILERPNKGKVYQYRAATVDGSQSLRIFQKDLEVRHRAWGSGDPYQPFRPFGDTSRESGARI